MSSTHEYNTFRVYVTGTLLVHPPAVSHQQLMFGGMSWFDGLWSVMQVIFTGSAGKSETKTKVKQGFFFAISNDSLRLELFVFDLSTLDNYKDVSCISVEPIEN